MSAGAARVESLTDSALSPSDSDYAMFAAAIERHLGIRLPPEKRLLVARRMRPVIVASGHTSFHDWLRANLAGPPTPALLSDLADALTTNHTFFWREPAHFEHLRDVALPDRMRVRAGQRDVRVWCAAAATGEEPYQLAMVLRDVVPPDWTAGLLATDISAKALEVAKAGRYPAQRLGQLPPGWRKYVAFDAEGNGTMIPALRRDITFRRLNLVRDGWPFRAPFDVVFCRNVLIYFDPPVRDRVLDGIVGLLAPGGYLYVGHAESVPKRWPLVGLGAGVWRKT